MIMVISNQEEVLLVYLQKMFTGIESRLIGL